MFKVGDKITPIKNYNGYLYIGDVFEVLEIKEGVNPILVVKRDNENRRQNWRSSRFKLLYNPIIDGEE